MRYSLTFVNVELKRYFNTEKQSYSCLLLLEVSVQNEWAEW